MKTTVPSQATTSAVTLHRGRWSGPRSSPTQQVPSRGAIRKCGHTTQEAAGVIGNVKSSALGDLLSHLVALPRRASTLAPMAICTSSPASLRRASTRPQCSGRRDCSACNTGALNSAPKCTKHRALGFRPATWAITSPPPTAGLREMDVHERVNGAAIPDWNKGSIHGKGFAGSNIATTFYFSSGQTAAGWNRYGIFLKKESASY